ncbi:MAG TPA: sialate O-acetylesterase [Chitinophagaceae bacterium]|nr:sialate O-acetylesterase [Chitinophagaceae bacterium]
MKKAFFVSTALLLLNSLCAQLRLPAIISSHMVLQQKDSVWLWGWAGPGEKVYITTGWNQQRDSVTTNHGARWKLKVKTPAAGGPFTVSFNTNSHVIVLENVMVGEVWVCSGQSNMEWSYNNGEKDTRAEMASAANNNIHFFQVPKSTADAPQDDVKAQWLPCDSNTLKSFSAVGYFFGKKLQRQLNVPIGLINSSWGGTPAEVWAPEETVLQDETLKTAAAKIKPAAWWPNEPGQAYNAMIAPLTMYSIAGAIWYQGESNTGTYDTYGKLLAGMIDAWRKAWHKELPFYYVQIAPYKYGNNNIGALLQEAQTKLQSHPHVGMVVVTDLIDSATNIHPSHKREVGNRLANWALGDAYQQPNIPFKNPALAGAEVKGSTIVVSVSNAPMGFQLKEGGLKGFYISGEPERWVPAEARIVHGKIVLQSKQVPQPKYVRYGFGNTLAGNVITAEGLPLTPFRTDNWAVDQSPVQ